MEDSKTDIGWGHQIRSYVLDQSRIKDLRTNVEVGNTQAVLDGDLDDFIAASLKQGVCTSRTMTEPQPTPPLDTNQIIEERRAKLAALREQGNAFPNDFAPHRSRGRSAREQYDGKENDELEPSPVRVAVAGRMMLKRVMGKASFATLQDMSGKHPDLRQTDDRPGGRGHDAFKHWDLGDILGVEGTLFKTKTGELTVRGASSIRLLTKSLRPLPEKFHGLTDQEQKYRQRYVDLIMNDESRAVFVQRSRSSRPSASSSSRAATSRSKRR